MNAAETAALGAIEPALLADILLPGRGADWPAASAVLTGAALDTALSGFATLLPMTAAMSEEAAIAALRAAEESEPVAFSRALGQLTDAYYGTAPVQARCAELADAAPWPASGPLFDPALLKRG